MSVELKPCCVEYLADLDHVETDWRDELAEGHLTQVAFDACIAQNAEVRRRIRTGTYEDHEGPKSCPWENPDWSLGQYIAMTRFFRAGGKAADLVAGPIEVVPKDVLDSKVDMWPKDLSTTETS